MERNMPLENISLKPVSDTVRKSVQAIDSAVRKIWTLLDSASEKKLPTEYLKQNAVRAIQGKQTLDEK
jgi:hypothetical protein